MTIEDQVLRDLHRAALDAGRPRVAIPSADLPAVVMRAGSQASVDQALHRLTQAGRVVRVRRDLLVLPDGAGLLGMDLVDIIDATAAEPYLITAGRALEHASLTDQHSFGVVVLSSRAVRPLRWRGQVATFYRTDPDNLWGFDLDRRPRYALPERALLDVFNHPGYGVSLDQALRALTSAVHLDATFLDRLHAAVLRYGGGSRDHGARAVARRVGLVVDRLFGSAASAPYRDLVGTNWAPVLLRPGGSADGELDRSWRVMVNATLSTEGTR